MRVRRPSAGTGSLDRMESCGHAKGELPSEHGIEEGVTMNGGERWGGHYGWQHVLSLSRVLMKYNGPAS